MYFSFPLTPDKLTAAEQLIIEYITGHRDEFLCMTIGQLSDELNLSEATISGLPAMLAAAISNT